MMRPASASVMHSLQAALLSLLLLGAPEADERHAEAALHFQKGNDAARAQRFEEAIAEFTTAFDLLPSTSALYNLGQCYEEVGRDAEALATFQRVIQMIEATPAPDEAAAGMPAPTA